MANKPTTKKTASTGVSGGNKYQQMAVGRGFVAIPPRTGHTQKRNIKPATKSK